jgi:hypothetical protein
MGFFKFCEGICQHFSLRSFYNYTVRLDRKSEGIFCGDRASGCKSGVLFSCILRIQFFVFRESFFEAVGDIASSDRHKRRLSGRWQRFREDRRVNPPALFHLAKPCPPLLFQPCKKKNHKSAIPHACFPPNVSLNFIETLRRQFLQPYLDFRGKTQPNIFYLTVDSCLLFRTNLQLSCASSRDFAVIKECRFFSAARLIDSPKSELPQTKGTGGDASTAANSDFNCSVGLELRDCKALKQSMRGLSTGSAFFLDFSSFNFLIKRFGCILSPQTLLLIPLSPFLQKGLNLVIILASPHHLRRLHQIRKRPIQRNKIRTLTVPRRQLSEAKLFATAQQLKVFIATGRILQIQFSVSLFANTHQETPPKKSLQRAA